MKETIVPVTEFKAKCLRLLDEVASSSKGIVITKRGVPVARVTPYAKRPASAMGSLKGTCRIVGDIVNFDTSELWEVLR